MKNLFIALSLIFFMSPAFAENRTLFIPDVKKEQVMDAIAQLEIEKNCDITQQTNYSLVVMKKFDSSEFGEEFKYMTSFDGNPEKRIKFNFIEKNGGVLISFSGEVVSNPRSSHEFINPYSEKNLNKLNKELSDAISGYYSYGIEAKKFFGFLQISKIDPSSIAASELKDTDLILKVNDIPVKDNQSYLIKYFSPSKEDEILKLNIRTVSGLIKTTTKDITLVSKYYPSCIGSKHDIKTDLKKPEL